jgi:hypothetical protein
MLIFLNAGSNSKPETPDAHTGLRSSLVPSAALADGPGMATNAKLLAHNHKTGFQ